MDRNFLRLLDTLQLVPVGRKASTEQIHQNLAAMGHAVSVRTVQRDLEALASHYPLRCDAASKPYGWDWQPGHARPVIAPLDLSQALAFNLLEREYTGLMPQAARQVLAPWLAAAREKLRTQGHTKAARWASKVALRQLGPPLLRAKVQPTVLEAVSEALFLEQKIVGQYRSAPSADYRTVQLNPLGLVHTDLVTYLAATFEGYADVRLIVLHRLRKVRLQHAAVDTPPGFDLATYLDAGALNFRNEGVIVLKLRMRASAAAHLEETPLSLDQVMTPANRKGDVTVTATVQKSLRLLWWLRGFGEQVTVLAPQNLRDEI